MLIQPSPDFGLCLHGQTRADPPRHLDRRQTDVGEHLAPLGVREELLRDPEPPYGYVDFGVTERQRDGGAHSGGPAVVLDDGDQPVFRGEAGQRGVDGLDPTRVHHRAVDAPRLQQLGGLEAHRGHHTDGHQQHLGPLATMQHVQATDPVDRRHRRPHGFLREPHQGRRVVHGDRLPQLRPQLVGVPRSGDPQSGDDLEDRHVPHAVVGGPVDARDPGPVQDERDPATVQGDVHQELVEGPVQEGRVHGDDRMQPTGGKTRGGDGRVLLGDSDVPHPVGETRRELPEAHRVQHGRRDRHDVLPLLPDRDDLVAEHRGPGGPVGRRERLTGEGVHHTDGVEVILFMGQGGLVTAPLLRQAVDENRSVEALGAPQRRLHGPDVVSVDRADVLQPEVLEHALRREGVLEALLRAVQGLVDGVADQGVLRSTSFPQASTFS